jgi:hypothetical protein
VYVIAIIFPALAKPLMALIQLYAMKNQIKLIVYFVVWWSLREEWLVGIQAVLLVI